MKNAILMFVVLLATGLGLSARGVHEVKSIIYCPSDAALKRLAVSGEKERFEILRKLRTSHSDLQARLIKELDVSTDNEKKFAIVYLMGLYRLEGAVPELAKIIDLKAKERPDDAEFLFWDLYPVVEALIKIGRPSIPAMLDNIRANKGEKVTKLSVDVIQDVETPTIARMILQDIIAKEKDPTKEKGLQRSLKYLRDN